MGHFSLTIIGTTPLVCHNVQLADKENTFAQQIAALTDESKKTPQMMAEIERLEWIGGLYLVDGYPGPVLPTFNIYKCFVDAARSLRLGKHVERSLRFLEQYVIIEHDGPKDLKRLATMPAFRDRRPVRIGGRGLIMRVRPKFSAWQIHLEGFLLESILGRNDFDKIVSRAGQSEGIGDARKLWMGRFDGKALHLDPEESFHDPEPLGEDDE